MKFFERLYNFLLSIFSPFLVKQSPPQLEQHFEHDENIVDLQPVVDSIKIEDRISAAHKTTMTKLYILEQEIAVFEKDFPDQYYEFMERINGIRDQYNSDMQKAKSSLTFEIDPDYNSNYSGLVRKLESEIKKFIETQVKFDTISKRFQELDTKLNILYNVSIEHSKPIDKSKVISRLKIALESATRLTKEFKENSYIISDSQLKERIFSLISYFDYEFLKLGVRNSDRGPDEFIKFFIMISEFDNFDYISSVKAFLKDELSDLGELLPLISDEEYRKFFENNYDKLLAQILAFDVDPNRIHEKDFWNSYIDFETTLISILKKNGVDSDKAKVKIIDRMDICINPDDLVVLPITIANLSMISICSKNSDDRILLLLKLFKHLSKDITYKEIYFLASLFDCIEIILTVPNELCKHIEKYVKQFGYDPEAIKKKKKAVLANHPSDQYVVVFSLNEFKDKYIKTLQSLDIDFKVENNNVLINSYYFNGLNNVLKSFA